MKYIKKSLYLLLILLLILPLTQLLFPFVELKDLDGHFELVSKPTYELSKFKNGEYQEEFESYLKDSIGFHNFFIRLNNQINYSLFNKSNASGVVEKNKMLIPESYIRSTLGLDYKGEKKLREYVSKIKVIQDSLHKRGKHFIYLHVPGKASIYPENIPDKFLEKKKDENNYSTLLNLLSQYQIHHIDFYKYLLLKKNKLESQIFANNSVHWSGNTVSVVADTLTNYIRSQFKLNTPLLKRLQGIKTVKDYRYTDYDIAKSMNLFWNIAEDTLYYPKIEFISNNAAKPSFLGCGDSFFQSFNGFYPILDSVFSSESKFYYYNRLVDWPKKYKIAGVKAKELNIEIEFNRTDVVILESTDENIPLFGFGFVDDLYNHFTNNNITDSKSIEKIIELEKVKNRAKTIHRLVGYSYEDMLYSIASSQSKSISKEEFEKLVQQKKLSILKTPKWVSKVKKQAIERDITFEENLRLNAEYAAKKSLNL